MEKTETAIMFAYSELCTTIDEQRPLEQRKSFLSRVFRRFFNEIVPYQEYCLVALNATCDFSAVVCPPTNRP